MEKRTLTAEDILAALEADDPRAHINQRDERCCIVDGEFNLANIASLLNAKLAEPFEGVVGSPHKHFQRCWGDR